MSKSASSFKSWMDQDPNTVWGLVVALGITLIFLVRLLRSKGDGGEKKASSPSPMPTPEQSLHLIKTRRSVTPKDYADAASDPVTEEELSALMEAANWAPTHGKTEPWRYVVFSGSEAILSYLDFLEDWYEKKRESLSDEASRKFGMKLKDVRSSWPGRVSHLALICMKRQALPDKRMPEWEEICAVAMSVQNAHLQATTMGLGVFWSSHTWCKDARDSVEYKSAFGFDEEDKLMGAITIGRVREGAKVKSTRNPVAEKVQRRSRV